MDVAGIRSSAELNPTAQPGQNEELGKNQFLELMIAQMNNQDPLDPAKNEDFIAQLAQFSTVEGIENMNKAMTDMAGAMQSSMAIEASSLVGRNVIVPTGQVLLSANGINGSIDVTEAAGNVTVEISTAAGELVRRIDLGPRGAGALQFGWDGTNAAGQPLPQGAYRVNAYSGAGDERRAYTVNLPDQVVSVSITDNGVIANLASGDSVSAAAIKEIQ